MSEENIKHWLKEKYWVLWASLKDGKIEAVAFTEVIDYPLKKICVVRGLTGRKFKNWIYHEEQIAEWAKSIGCDGMESIARAGWARIFKKYTQSHVFLERMF